MQNGLFWTSSKKLTSMRAGLGAGCGAVAFLGAVPAVAQESGASADTQSTGLDVIVVTARKQSESILDVPVTASALSSEELNRYGTKAVTDINVPSVNFDRTNNGGGGSLTIRGIGSSTFDTGIEQAVATVIDGVQTSRGNFIESGLFDLEQIEVLKGPQALFFGKNSPGGVLSLSSKGPGNELEAYLKAGYEFDAHEKTVEGAVGGPLSDSLGARLAVRWNDSRGWLENTSLPTADIFGNPADTLPAPPYRWNSTNSLTGRLTLVYDPGSDFKATLRLLGTHSEDRGPNANTEISSCGGAAAPIAVGVVPVPTADCVIDGRNQLGPVPDRIAGSHSLYRGNSQYGDFKAYLASLTLDYSLGNVDLTSVTGYLDYSYKRVLSRPHVYGYGFLAEDEQYNQFTQELRAVTQLDGPVNFSGGIYFESNELSTVYPNALLPHRPDDFSNSSRPGSFLSYIFNQGSKATSYSVFGQVRWNLTDQIEIDAGARYSHDIRKGNLGNSYLNPYLLIDTMFPALPEGTFFSGKKKFNNFSPEVTLSYKPNQDILIFGSYKTGYKAGGAASPAILPITFNPNTNPTSRIFYDPEEIKGFEAGFKGQFLDNRLRITAAVYTYKYTDLQVSNFNATQFNIQALNVGALRSKGFEIEMVANPTAGLTFNGSVGYSRARYLEFSGISCYAGQSTAAGCDMDPLLPDGLSANPAFGTQDLTGQQKYRSPDWTWSAGFNYDAPVTDNLVLGFSGNVRGKSDYFGQENNSPFSIQDGFYIVDASVRIGDDNDRWQLALIGRNLTNELYSSASLDSPLGAPGQIESVVSRPRQFALEATFRY